MMSYGWTHEYVRKRLPGHQGWAFYHYAVAQEAARMMQSPLEPVGSYVRQQIDTIYERRAKCST